MYFICVCMRTCACALACVWRASEGETEPAASQEVPAVTLLDRTYESWNLLAWNGAAPWPPGKSRHSGCLQSCWSNVRGNRVPARLKQSRGEIWEEESWGYKDEIMRSAPPALGAQQSLPVWNRRRPGCCCYIGPPSLEVRVTGGDKGRHT